jgi:hypothetical protein
MAGRHDDDSRGKGLITTRRSVLQFGGLSVGALLGGGAANAVAAEEPACEPGEDPRMGSVSFGTHAYGASGYGGVA